MFIQKVILSVDKGVSKSKGMIKSCFMKNNVIMSN